MIMILLSGFFSGMEIAFVSSSRLKQELDLKKEILPARILSIFYKNPSRFIGALLLGNNIALVIYGIAMAIVLKPVIIDILPEGYSSEFVILLSQTIVSTLIILITAEFIPKVLFRINPNAILKFFAIPVWLFYFIFYPLILLYIGVAELLLKNIFKVRLSTTSYNFSSIDLEEYVKEYLPDEEKTEEVLQEMQMIQNAMGFKNVKLRDCLVPRTEIAALDINDTIETYRELFIKTGHSKLMTYQDSIDNLIGYVHAYDMFSKPTSIIEILRKADVFPETMAAIQNAGVISLSNVTKGNDTEFPSCSCFISAAGMLLIVCWK